MKVLNFRLRPSRVAPSSLFISHNQWTLTSLSNLCLTFISTFLGKWITTPVSRTRNQAKIMAPFEKTWQFITTFVLVWATLKYEYQLFYLYWNNKLIQIKRLNMESKVGQPKREGKPCGKPWVNHRFESKAKFKRRAIIVSNSVNQLSSAFSVTVARSLNLTSHQVK